MPANNPEKLNVPVGQGPGPTGNEGFPHSVVPATGSDPFPISGSVTAVTTLADGANVVEGMTTDAATTTDVAGTLSAKLRGLIKILGDVWDAVNHRLKVDGSGVTQPVSGTFWQGTQPVSAASLPLAANAAQEAGGNLAAIKADVDNIPAKGQAAMAASMPVAIASNQSAVPVSGTFWQATQPISGTVTANQGGTWTVQPGNTPNTTAWKVDGSSVTQPVSGTFWQATQPVSATSLPLPTGAATEATLAGVKNGTDRLPAQGQAAMAASMPVTIANNQSAVPVSGTFWQATQPVSGTFWQATQPVSGTFWQATQPISAASLPLPSGASTAAKQPALGTAGTASADVITVQGASGMTAVKVDGSAVTQPVSGTFFQATQPISAASLPLPTGAATETTLALVKTDVDKIPSQGQAAMAASMPVAIASNQSAISTTPTETRPTSVVTKVDLLAADDFTRVLTLLVANTGRRGATIKNGTDAVIPIKEGAGASPTSYTDLLGPGEEYVLDYPVSTAILTAYLAQVPNGSLFVTERA